MASLFRLLETDLLKRDSQPYLGLMHKFRPSQLLDNAQNIRRSCSYWEGDKILTVHLYVEH